VLARYLECSIIKHLEVENAGLVYVGDEDRRFASQMTDASIASSIFSLPLAVDTDAFSPGISPPHNSEKIILFTGHMGYGPNIAAAKDLVTNVVPLIVGTVQVKLAGKAPAPEILALGKRDSRVCVTGEVLDIVSEYRSADVFVAPISFSYGMKTKIIEAMSCGLPIVASPGAASGFPGVPPGILVGTNDEELAKLTSGLLHDESRRRALGNAGREYVLQHHRWIDRTRMLLKLLDGRQ
jgi:glycosyltransferase involved in cell wall biosynthesis